MPVAKPAFAGEKKDNSLPSVGEYTLFVSAGMEHLVASRVINSQIHGKELEGFNPGCYIEIGVFNWSGQHGKTNYEYHIGFSGRFDYHDFHSRAYNMNAETNANVLAGETFKYVDPAEHGCSHVQDYINTFNLHSDFGWVGLVFTTNVGVGWHFDNQGNYGPVLTFGGGLGYRFNKNWRLDAKWRLNTFPCENLNSKTHLPTTPGLRNSLELGVIYKLDALRKDQMNEKHRNGKHR